MTTEATPANVGSNDMLGPLPEPAHGFYASRMFSADQMRAYAKQAVDLERERWIDACQQHYALAIGRNRHHTADAILCIREKNRA